MRGRKQSHNEPGARTADLHELKATGVCSQLCCRSPQKNDKLQSQPVRGGGFHKYCYPDEFRVLLPYSEIKRIEKMEF